jgi:predicted double-glycine peptidase
VHRDANARERVDVLVFLPRMPNAIEPSRRAARARAARAARVRALSALFAAALASDAWAQASQDASRRAAVDVSGYSIEGSLHLDDFTRLVSPYLGPRRTAADIERARSAVQQAYHDLGYCSVRVELARPEPLEGVVLLRLAEIPANEIRECLPKIPLAATPKTRDACAAAGPRAAGCQDSQVVIKTGAVRTELPVRSLRALRDAGVVKQRYDYSCGSASLATLLTYGLNDPVDENALLRAILEPLSLDELKALQKKGLSLFDLQKLAQERGHKAQGFRVHQSQLAKLSRPVIVFIKPHGYEHFAVLKGLRGDRAYLADPSLGNVRMPIYRFLDMWADASGHGVIFAVERAAGDWPEQYALKLAGVADPPLEALSAERMMSIGRPYPLIAPDR